MDNKRETIISTLLVMAVTALTFGVLIPWLGYYRDDWYMIWSAQAQGTAGVVALFQSDRPFMGMLYAFDYLFLGQSPLAWHIFALLAKTAGALAFFWLARLLWPEKRLETLFAALLFVVYPGFLQEPNANTFQNHLVGYAAAILSIALTLRAMQSPGRFARLALTLLSMALALFYFFIYEYMIGLEAARVLLIWYVCQRGSLDAWKAKLSTTIKWALPYLLPVIGFVFWRLFIFKSTRKATNVDAILTDYLSAPLNKLFGLLVEFVRSTFSTVVSAWLVPFYRFTGGDRYRDLLAGLLLAGLVLVLVGLYLYWRKRQAPEQPAPAAGDNTFIDWMWLGLVIVVATLAPLVVAGRSVSFSLQWDRYTLQSSLGAVLVVSGFAFQAFKGKFRMGVLLFLIAIGVMVHYQSAAFYRNFWDYERAMWWQLSWRAPGLQAGTAVLAALPEGYRYAEEYEVWAPLNIIYHRGQELQVSGQVVNNGLVLDLAQAATETRTMRSIPVKRDFGQALVISIPSSASCLHVLDGRQLANPIFEAGDVNLLAPYSRIELIKTSDSAKTPAQIIFGLEPPHDWCYYYQKIGLALQAGDNAQAARLVEEVAQKGLKPGDETEWLPVLEAYILTGQAGKAERVARVEIDPDTRKYICLQAQGWERPEGSSAQLVYSLLCNK